MTGTSPVSRRAYSLALMGAPARLIPVLLPPSAPGFFVGQSSGSPSWGRSRAIWLGVRARPIDAEPVEGDDTFAAGTGRCGEIALELGQSREVT